MKKTMWLMSFVMLTGCGYIPCLLSVPKDKQKAMRKELIEYRESNPSGPGRGVSNRGVGISPPAPAVVVCEPKAPSPPEPTPTPDPGLPPGKDMHKDCSGLLGR